MEWAYGDALVVHHMSAAMVVTAQEYHAQLHEEAMLATEDTRSIALHSTGVYVAIYVAMYL